MSKTERATVKTELEILKVTKLEGKIFELATNTGEDYVQLAYDTLGLLSIDPETAKKDIADKLYGFDSNFFTEAKARHLKQLSRINEKPKAVKGVYKCSAKLSDGSVCGSDSFFMWSQQTRSGDEGMTHFRQCEKCGKRNKS